MLKVNLETQEWGKNEEREDVEQEEDFYVEGGYGWEGLRAHLVRSGSGNSLWTVGVEGRFALQF